MKLEIYKYRSGLLRLLKNIKNGQATIGFIGGSITDAESEKRWPEYVAGWFANTFPNMRFCIENAAIGATCSDLAVFRAERDLINRGCDVVFIEYAVNDLALSSEKRMRSREGLIRKLLKVERDIVLTYAYSKEMYEEMINGEIPESIKEFENLAEHYNISAVWMGLYGMKEVQSGMMRWEEWLPDGLHPDFRGSYSYAQSVIDFLKKELIDNPNQNAVTWGDKLPEAYNKNNWERTRFIQFSKVNLNGNWYVKRARNHNMIDQILTTAAPGAKLWFTFKGRGLCLACDFGKTSAEFRYRLDEDKWIETKRAREWWVNDSGWFKLENLYDDLENTDHKFELEVINGNRDECKGTNFRLIFIGVLE